MISRKNNVLGYLYVILATTLWGSASVLAKSLINSGLSPFLLAQIRLSLAALILFLIILFFDQRRLRISMKDLPYFIIFGIVGMVGNQLMFYLTISKIQVAPTVLIQYLSVLWVAIYASLFQEEPFSRRTAVSLCLAILGCYLAVGGYQFDFFRMNRVGILMGTISSFFIAFYVLY